MTVVDLPNYQTPPLSEVVMGVQFLPIPNYTSIDACKVWELFKEEYPTVQEMPPIENQFETFGGIALQPSFQLNFGTSPVKSRLWFISPDQNHILQYQSDMFLLNWRKSSDVSEYPRFDGIVKVFENAMETLNAFLMSRFAYTININQVEITYINFIPIDAFSRAGDWLRMCDFQAVDIESLNIMFTEVIRDDEGNPFARFKYTVQSAAAPDGLHKALQLVLTYKGKPAGDDAQAALEFLRRGREMIVNRFDSMTTENAHKSWEKGNG